MSTNISTTRKHHPGFLTIVGLIFLAIFLMCVMFQIQTNEAYFLNQNVNGFQSDWAVFMQIPNMLLGNTGSQAQAIATMASWIVEAVSLGLVIGFEHMKHAVSLSGKIAIAAFVIGSLFIYGFNFMTDYTYGTLGSGIGGHLSFALFLSFAVFFFGTIGIKFIEMGWTHA